MRSTEEFLKADLASVTQCGQSLLTSRCRQRRRSNFRMPFGEGPVAFHTRSCQLGLPPQVSLEGFRGHLVSAGHEGVEFVRREGVQVGAKLGDRLLEIFSDPGWR